jgi:hypothetical protein
VLQAFDDPQIANRVNELTADCEDPSSARSELADRICAAIQKGDPALDERQRRAVIAHSAELEDQIDEPMTTSTDRAVAEVQQTLKQLQAKLDEEADKQKQLSLYSIELLLQIQRGKAARLLASNAGVRHALPTLAQARWHAGELLETWIARRKYLKSVGADRKHQRLIARLEADVDNLRERLREGLTATLVPEIVPLCNFLLRGGEFAIIARPAAPTASAQGQSAGAAGADTQSQWASLMNLAKVVGAGLGVLGFVTFFGGAILYVRFRDLGLPAAYTVALVSRSDLLATGAQFLVVALALEAALLGLLVVGRLLRSLLSRYRGRSREPISAWGKVSVGWQSIVNADPRTLVKRPGSDSEIWLALLLLAVQLAYVVFEWVAKVPSAWLHVAALILIAFVTTAVCYGAYLETKNYYVFLYAALAASALTIVVSTYYRTENVKVEPVAVLLHSEAGIEIDDGYFVAETSDRVYLADATVLGRLIEVPRDDVVAMTTGPLLTRAKATGSAIRLAKVLCRSDAAGVGPSARSIVTGNAPASVRKLCRGGAPRRPPAQSPRLRHQLASLERVLSETFDRLVTTELSIGSGGAGF